MTCDTTQNTAAFSFITNFKFCDMSTVCLSVCLCVAVHTLTKGPRD